MIEPQAVTGCSGLKLTPYSRICRPIRRTKEPPTRRRYAAATAGKLTTFRSPRQLLQIRSRDQLMRHMHGRGNALAAQYARGQFR
jgi:hypothetical protein